MTSRTPARSAACSSGSVSSSASMTTPVSGNAREMRCAASSPASSARLAPNKTTNASPALISRNTSSIDDAGAAAMPASSSVIRVRKRSSGSSASTRSRSDAGRLLGTGSPITALTNLCRTLATPASLPCGLELREGVFHEREVLVPEVHLHHDLAWILEVTGFEGRRVQREKERRDGLRVDELLRLARRHLERDQG